MNISSQPISNELINKISQQLNDNAHIDEMLDNQGRLHFDRQLPYLCVHRQIDDLTDTGQLLHGQAAYLTVHAQANCRELVHEIVKNQSTRFGQFLIIELWTNNRNLSIELQPPAPEFSIHTPQKGIANDILDTFEIALQKIKLRQRHAVVKTNYADHCAPPDLPPLLNREEASQLKCIILGLEVAPVYRDENNQTLPYALRVMRRELTHALKKVFYQFSHYYTHFQPRHYHELGPRALTKTVWQVDQQLAEISESFDLLLHVTPTNAAQAWTEFTTNGHQKTPEFHYRARNVDPTTLKRKLYHILLERIEDPTLADLFTAKRDELDRQITLLNDRNSEAFLYGSIQLFGQIDKKLLEDAQLIIRHSSDSRISDGEKLSATQLAIHANEELEHYRKSDPSFAAKVEVRDDITGILVSHGNFLIGSDAKVSKARLSATLNHEIGTHALTYHNGKKQPMQQLYAGMAGYEELQEGLAVLAEYLSDGLALSRLQLLAGRVIAVHNIIDGADFVECYRSLREDYGFHTFTAFNMTMRIYRGGGYTKDMIYLRGFIKLIHYLAKNEDMTLLYCGKIAMEHLHLLQELRWRKVLKPLALTPRYLQDAMAQKRLKTLRDTPSIHHILGSVI